MEKVFMNKKFLLKNMNRIQYRVKRKSVSDSNIALIIPSTTKGTDVKNVDDLIFFRVFLPSFLKTFSGDYFYNFYIGYDHDDKYYGQKNFRDQFSLKFRNQCPHTFSLELICFEKNIENGDLSTMWSILAEKAKFTNDYLYQLGDDIEFKSRGWERKFTSYLKEKNNIGVVGPKDENNKNKILTQSFVHNTHLSIFKRFFPQELKNWYIDDWITEIYDGHICKNIFINNSGGKERYDVVKLKKTKDIIVSKDRQKIQNIRKKKIIVRSNSYICAQIQDIFVISNPFCQKYDFSCDNNTDAKDISVLVENIKKGGDIHIQFKGKNFFRHTNHIHSSGGDSTTIQNIENTRISEKIEKIFLFQQFYIPNDKERYEEVKDTLHRNSSLLAFEKIYLLNERIYTAEEMGYDTIPDNIEQIVIKRRMTYDDFLNFSSRLDGYCIVSNADIFFDLSITNIFTSHMRNIKSVQCLRRYEYRQEKNLSECKIYHNYNCSQDCWIVHSRWIQSTLKTNIEIGISACDNKISYIFKKDGFLLLNDQERIRTYHNHRSLERNCGSKRYSSPYVFILNGSPCNRGDHIVDKNELFWQYPVITEKTFYDQNRLDDKYLGIPWATIIDKKNSLEIEGFKKIKGTYTCCQHIRFRTLIPLMKNLGVEKIYSPHKIVGEDTIDGIKILPCPLYAKVVETNKINTLQKRPFLYSFKGAYQQGYMSDIRKRIFSMKHPENTYIQDIGSWHFNQIVYSTKQDKSQEYNIDRKYRQREKEYVDLITRSRYTLCPSGTGPSSIRFWESLGSGSIPILLSDNLDLPKHKLWEKTIVRISEKDVEKISSIISEISSEEEENMRKNCLIVYNFFKDNYKG